MSKTVTIPNYTKPNWECCINGVMYRYTAGSTQEVPDEVAALIDDQMKQQPKPEEDGETGNATMDIVIKVPFNFGGDLSKVVKEVKITKGSMEAVRKAVKEGRIPKGKVIFKGSSEVTEAGIRGTVVECQASFYLYGGFIQVGCVGYDPMDEDMYCYRFVFDNTGKITTINRYGFLSDALTE